MPWDLPHLRVGGFVVQILRPAGVYGILANLAEFPHLHPSEMTRLLCAADAVDAPTTGARGFDLYGVSHRLTLLRACGLVVRCDEHPDPGSHTSYELTRLGAGLIGSLSALTDWGMDNYDLAVAAARRRAGLPGGFGPVDPALRRPRPATGMALGLLGMHWSWSLMAQVRIAGPGGVESEVARAGVNAVAQGMPEGVGRELRRATGHRVLRHLENVGLVARFTEPRFGRSARVLYCATEAGVGLMKALWLSAEWGVGHDRELATAVAMTSTWFEVPAAGL